MSPAVVYLLTHLLLIPLGASAALHPSVRDLPAAARLGFAFGCGAIFLTIEGLLFSLAGVPWSVASLSFPLLALSAVVFLVTRRRRAAPAVKPPPLPLSRSVAVLGARPPNVLLRAGDSLAASGMLEKPLVRGSSATPPRGQGLGDRKVPRLRVPVLPLSLRPRRARDGHYSVRLLACAAILLGLVHLSLSLATARSTSADFLFFWGVKAARFAEAKRIPPELLDWTYFGHAVPEYPPLVPVVGAFSVLAAGEMPWRRAPIASMFWVAAAVPLIFGLFRRRLGSDAAAAVTAFWGAALSISLAHSYSGGNAEAPLLFFESVAAAALLSEKEGEGAPARFLPALAMAGAVLTKVEAVVAVLLLLVGTILRDRLERRPAPLRRALPLIVLPALALLSWFAFQGLSGLPVGYRAHGSFFAITFAHIGSLATEFFRQLNADTYWISWLLPLALLAASRRFRSALPALLPAAGLLAFFAFDYLHDFQDPAVRIGWTLPRVSQPALSLMILAAGMVTRGLPSPRTAPGAPGRSFSRRRSA